WPDWSAVELAGPWMSTRSSRRRGERLLASAAKGPAGDVIEEGGGLQVVCGVGREAGERRRHALLRVRTRHGCDLLIRRRREDVAPVPRDQPPVAGDDRSD